MFTERAVEFCRLHARPAGCFPGKLLVRLRSCVSFQSGGNDAERTNAAYLRSTIRSATRTLLLRVCEGWACVRKGGVAAYIEMACAQSPMMSETIVSRCTRMKKRSPQKWRSLDAIVEKIADGWTFKRALFRARSGWDMLVVCLCGGRDQPRIWPRVRKGPAAMDPSDRTGQSRIWLTGVQSWADTLTAMSCRCQSCTPIALRLNCWFLNYRRAPTAHRPSPTAHQQLIAHHSTLHLYYDVKLSSWWLCIGYKVMNPLDFRLPSVVLSATQACMENLHCDRKETQDHDFVKFLHKILYLYIYSNKINKTLYNIKRQRGWNFRLNFKRKFRASVRFQTEILSGVVMIIV